MLGYFVYVVKAVWEVFTYFIRSKVLGRPVSYPGDAIPNPQTRHGDWPNRTFRIDSNWKFASDADSHVISEKQTPNHLLTGESAGRQIWYQDQTTSKKKSSAVREGVDFNASVNPNTSDQLLRNYLISQWKGDKPDTSSSPSTAKEAAHKGMSFFQMVQCEDGHWAGDYGGPMFLLPGLVCALYLTQVPYPEGRREGMVAYLKNHQQVA